LKEARVENDSLKQKLNQLSVQLNEFEVLCSETQNAKDDLVCRISTLELHLEKAVQENAELSANCAAASTESSLVREALASATNMLSEAWKSIKVKQTEKARVNNLLHDKMMELEAIKRDLTLSNEELIGVKNALKQTEVPKLQP
jgi:chromosome segregation ATPase